jgi:hypothetical protein
MNDWSLEQGMNIKKSMKLRNNAGDPCKMLLV